jgi:hypothetical protein
MATESKSLDYLEKLFFDAYKRECDQEENIYRSLPFFIAGLALAMTMLGMASQIIVSSMFFGESRYDFLIYCALAVFSVVLIALFQTLRCLETAVRARSFVQPPPETEIIQWREQLQKFYADAEEPAEESKDVEVLLHLKTFMVEEFAKSATNNRANNAKKLEARASAGKWLSFGLLSAMLLLVFVLSWRTYHELRTHDSGGLNAASQNAAADERSAPRAAARDRQRPPPAAAAGEPISDPGRAAAVGRRDEVERQPGAEDVKDKNTPSQQPASPPPQAAKPSPPPPPASQTFTRSDTTGGLQKRD